MRNRDDDYYYGKDGGIARELSLDRLNVVCSDTSVATRMPALEMLVGAADSPAPI